MMDCDELQTPLLDAQMALSKLHLCGLVWEVRTDFGTVCAGRTAILRKSDRFSQGSTHPGVDHPIPVHGYRSCEQIFTVFFLFIK